MSISLVVGDNGVITKSQGASEQTNRASAAEEVELAYTDLISEYYDELAKNASADKWDYLEESDFSRALEPTGTISNYNKAEDETITFRYKSNGKNAEYNITISPSGQVTAEVESLEKIARSDLDALRAYFIGKNVWSWDWGNGKNGWGPILEPNEILSDADDIKYIAEMNIKSDNTKEIWAMEYHSNFYRLTVNKDWDSDEYGNCIGVGYFGEIDPEIDVIGKSMSELYENGWEWVSSSSESDCDIYSYQGKNYEIYSTWRDGVVLAVKAKDFNLADNVIKFDAIENTPDNKNISVSLTGMIGTVEWNVDDDSVAKVLSNNENTAEIQAISNGFTKLRIKCPEYEYETYCIICVGDYDAAYEYGLPFGFASGMTWGEMLNAGFNTDMFGVAKSDGGMGCPIKKGEIIWDGWPLWDGVNNSKVFDEYLIVPERDYETYCY